MKNSTERPLLEATLEIGEALADTLIKNEALAAVPILGTAVAVCKSMDSFRNRIVAAKMLAFLERLPNADDPELAKIRAKVLADKEGANKVGETLVLVLDQLTDMRKPAMLAELFLCYVDGLFDQRDFRRLAQAISAAFIDDLIEFLVKDQDQIDHEILVNLASSGLTWITPGTVTIRNDGKGVQHCASFFGTLLLRAHGIRSLV